MPKIRSPWERKKANSQKKPVNGVTNGELDDFEEDKVTDPLGLEESSNQLVSLTKADKKNYEDSLKSIQQTKPGKKYEIVPIWTMEDADGQKGVPESPETQGRFRKYAEQGTFPAVLVLYNSSLAFVALHFVERNRWSTRDYVVEGLCQVKSKVCTENR